MSEGQLIGGSENDREEIVVETPDFTKLLNEWINSFSGLDGRGSIGKEPTVVTEEELNKRFRIK